MKKSFLKNSFPFSLLVFALFIIGSGCNPNNNNNNNNPTNSCTNGISYLLDGNLVSFDNAQVTAEIFNDAAIGKFYDIWTDENTGFYYHSTITDTNETSGFTADWFTTNDVGNIVFLNSKSNVNMTFTIDEGANAIGNQVTISFSGTYDENGNTHTITEGNICTTIDIIH